MNTKFVVVLSAVIIMLATAAAGMAYMAMTKRGERLVKQGDAALAAGNIADAAKFYERAVGKDRTKLAWLEKWRDTLVQVTPQPRSEYERQYNFYFNILLYIARIKFDDVDAQLAYLDEWYRRLKASGGAADQYELFVNAVEERIEALDPESEGAKRVLRFRGLADVARMSSQSVDEEVRARALSDLRGAIEADPTDAEAAMGVVRWHLAEEDRLRRLNREDLAAQAQERSEQEMQAIVAAFPEDPQVLRLDLAVDIARLQRMRPTREEAEAGVARMRPKAEHLMEVALRVPGDSLPPEFLEACRQTVPQVLGGADAQIGLRALADHMLEARPNDAELLLTSAQLYLDAGEWEAAIGESQKVVDLEDVPVSLEGLLLQNRRDLALAFQVDGALSLWQEEEDPEASARALERAKEYNERLRSVLGSRGTEMLLLRDAKIAMAERRFDVAIANLSELRRVGQTTRETLHLLSTALIAQGNDGEARGVLKELVERFGQIPSYVERLAEVEMRLRNFDDAEQLYAALADRFPENEAYRSRLAQIVTAQGQQVEGLEADPKVQQLLEARKLSGEGDYAGAESILRAGLAESPTDFRFIRDLANVLVVTDRRDEALSMVRDAASASPDNRALQLMVVQLEEDDPVRAGERVVEESGASEMEKAMTLHQLYMRSGLEDKAREQFARMESIDADDPRVIELGFLRALDAEDLDAARSIARRAAELDSDQLKGQLFQARIEIYEGNYAQAVQTLEQAVQRNPYIPNVWRILAEAQTEIGRVSDALNSYERAYEGRPNDVQIAKGLARTLVSLNRGAEALRYVGREGALRFEPNDPELLEMWLALEAQYGDRETALKVRRERFARDASDISNGAALVALLVEDEAWDEAGSVIETIATQDGVDPLLVAGMRARYASRDGDLDAGGAAYQAFVDSATEREQKLRGYLAQGEYFLRENEPDRAVASYEKAREFQSPGQMEADRRLGDHFFRRGLIESTRAGDATGEVITDSAREFFEKAVLHYTAVLDSSVSDEGVLTAVRKRHAETCLKLDRAQDALRDIEALAAHDADDLQVLVLRAAVLKETGDRRGARAALDRAAELYPSDPVPFIQRALLNQDDRNLFSDVVADLDHASQLRPGLVEPWLIRFRLLKEQGRLADALLELRKGQEANPDSDRLRITLVRELFQAGEREQAEKEVMEIASDRMNDVNWMRTAATLLGEGGRFHEAVPFAARAYELEPSVQNATMYLDIALQSDPEPEKALVNRLLSVVEPEVRESRSVNGFMLVARARYFLEEETEAMDNVGRALNATRGESWASADWLAQLRILFNNANNVFEFMQSVREEEKGRNSPILSPYLHTVLVNQRMLRNEDTGPLLARLEEIMAEEAAPDDYLTRVLIEQTRSAMYYNMGEYEKAAEALHRGIDFAKAGQGAGQDFKRDGADMSNNLAYILADHLKRWEEALEPAELAAELKPGSASTLDTLGWVYFNVGRHQEAYDTLQRASDIAQPLSMEKAIALVHLGFVQDALGDRLAARRSLEEAEEIAAKDPGVAQQIQKDIDALKDELG